MIMSSVSGGSCNSLVKQDKICKPESRRRKVDRIRPSRKNCAVGGGFDEECSVEIANKRAKVERLDHPIHDNGFNSEREVLINTKRGLGVGCLVGSGAIDYEVEEGEIVEEVIEDEVIVGSGKGIGQPGKNEYSREVEEGEIIEDDCSDCVKDASGKGDKVEKDKTVDVAGNNLNNAQSIKSRDFAMIDDPEKCSGYKLNGEINGPKMCSQGTKSVPRKKVKRVSACAHPIAPLSRCKAQADGSNNITVKPKRTSVPKMNVAKRVSVLDGKGESRDTLADKNLNDMSIAPSDSQETPIRKKVKETLNLFQQVLQNLLLSEVKVSQYTYVKAAMQLKQQGKWVNIDKRTLGAVPGVEIGDKYHCRAELVVIGLHHEFASGIHSMVIDGERIAISIVSSGRYANETEFPDVLIYSGEGGNPAIKDRQLEDQKLERGNLALKNSMDAGTPVRVVRGYRAWKSFRAGDKKREKEATFTYDGLYVVSKYWQEKGRHGNLIYMFQLDRIKGQPKLTANNLSSISKKFIASGSSAISSVSSRSRKCKRILGKMGKSKPLSMPENCQTLITLEKAEVPRNPLLVDDISYGKEKIAIRVFNDIDDAEPPVFSYIANMVYQHLKQPSTKTKSCQCIGGCSDSVKCSCVVKNRGKVPFNEDGAILRQKAIIYECGPSCKCPPSCNNRVSQLGLKFQLEVFRTESVGWGLRSQDFISSGSFICEYVGELLEDSQAEERSGSDDYLFNLGGNDEYTIDAGIYGNVGRFLNHSCSPNLYAQHVLYDHVNKRMPHVMLFATRDIPPLEEFTFDYNYEIDSVYDANGNVKTKICCCGAPDCRGRLY